MRSLAFVTGASLLMATAALAQSPSTGTASGQSAQSQSPQGQSDQAQTNQQEMQVQQQVHKNLQQEGFTDIRIVPRSFLVSAKDKQGNQVMMFVTPNSVTAVTKVPNSTTGQGGSMNGGGSESGQSTSPSSPSPSHK